MQDFDKSYSELKKDQLGREGDLLSKILGTSEELKDLSSFESDLGVRRNEILFKVTVEIEDTRNALKQAEQLVERLKKHLNQLDSLHRILTKK
jgi:phage gp29-like protein